MLHVHQKKKKKTYATHDDQNKVLTIFVISAWIMQAYVI